MPDFDRQVVLPGVTSAAMRSKKEQAEVANVLSAIEARADGGYASLEIYFTLHPATVAELRRRGFSYDAADNTISW